MKLNDIFNGHGNEIVISEGSLLLNEDEVVRRIDADTVQIRLPELVSEHLLSMIKEVCDADIRMADNGSLCLKDPEIGMAKTYHIKRCEEFHYPPVNTITNGISCRAVVYPFGSEEERMIKLNKAIETGHTNVTSTPPSPSQHGVGGYYSR